MRVGVLDILTDTPLRGPVSRTYAAYFRKQFTGIMPQAVSAWCRQLGHEVFYATYYGAEDPRSALPADLDIVFLSTYTQASALAYALAKLYRRDGVLTVLGGPHAKAFPEDSLRFFDIVVRDCDKALVDDILRGSFDPPQIVTSGRRLTGFPTIEERLPDIRKSAFVNGRPIFMSVIPMLSSLGCPYRCDFCIDWDNDYIALPEDQLEADLRFIADTFDNPLVAFHDPNFAVRFDSTMDVIERIPPGRRPRYVMESSLSILKEGRLARLRDTNCVYVAPGVESWGDYSNKSGAQGRFGRAKLDQVVEHFRRLGEFVPGMQANFLFGADVDHGPDPAALTKEFIRRLPRVWPTINIPTPFGATPLHAAYEREGRILKSLPFAFYHNPYLAIRLKHYDPITYYDHLIDIHRSFASARMMARRLAQPSRSGVRFIHALRTIAARDEVAALKRIRRTMATDRAFRAFHEGETERLPDFYRAQVAKRLGRYAELLSPVDILPDWGGRAAADIPPPGRPGRAPHDPAGAIDILPALRTARAISADQIEAMKPPSI
ncbi:MAG: radical SAM protein [Rhodospirillaceae bacterium]|nr:radical SAM protein [Rhodospirillaceae bacterium]